MAIARVRCKLPNPGGTGNAYNIFHIRTVGNLAGGETDLGEALQALEAFYTRVRTYIPSGVITVGEQCIWDPLGSPQYANVQPIDISGGTAQTGPALLAITATWYTDSATKSGRGRTFVGPLGLNALQNDGTPDPAVMTAMRDAAGALVSDSLTANGWSLVVLSQKQGIARDVTSWNVQDRFAYLSSRRD